jgi:hypothetical protein|tara:strand:- start:2571 stop:2843 length:273 start_codon:yes stop_codon:yes gene_type:complete
MADTTKVKICPTGQILKGGKCIPGIRKTVTRSFKTKGFDEASAKVKSSFKMTPQQKIAAYKAKKAKAGSSRGKSAYQIAREAAARHEKRK